MHSIPLFIRPQQNARKPHSPRPPSVALQVVADPNHETPLELLDREGGRHLKHTKLNLLYIPLEEEATGAGGGENPRGDDGGVESVGDSDGARDGDLEAASLKA